MQSLFNGSKNWTLTFNICLPNYPSSYEARFPIQGPVFKTTGWLQGQLRLSSFDSQLNEYQELLWTGW